MSDEWTGDNSRKWHKTNIRIHLASKRVFSISTCIYKQQKYLHQYTVQKKCKKFLEKWNQIFFNPNNNGLNNSMWRVSNSLWYIFSKLVERVKDIYRTRLGVNGESNSWSDSFVDSWLGLCWRQSRYPRAGWFLLPKYFSWQPPASHLFESFWTRSHISDPDPGPPRHRHVSRCLNMSRVEENVDNTDQWQQYETLESICDVNVQ